MNNLKHFHIHPEWKTIVAATFICGFIAHGYKFFNMLPTWDSMYSFYSNYSMATSGRCFYRLANGISSFYDIPWLIGILSLAYLSITNILLVELFHMKKRYTIILASGLLAVFPSVTSTFAYMFCADAYFLGLVFSVLGVYICSRYRHGMFSGALFICLSYGIYQAYISFSLILIIMLLLRDLYSEGYDRKRHIGLIVKYAGLIIIGSLFYIICYKFTLLITQQQLANYQGMDSLGIMTLGEYWQAIIKTIKACGRFILGSGAKEINLYAALNFIILSSLVCIIIERFLKYKIYRSVGKSIWFFFLHAIIPFALCIFYFVSPEVYYHLLMKMPFYLLYFMVILAIDNKEYKDIKRAVYILANISLVTVGYYNIVNANVAYQKMQFSYEKSYSRCQLLLNKIQDLNVLSLETDNKIAIIGFMKQYGELYRIVPDFTGISDTSFVILPDHYIAMYKNYFGIPFIAATEDEIKKIKETAEYKRMAYYPADDSVEIIDDCIVVKLSDQ